MVEDLVEGDKGDVVEKVMEKAAIMITEEVLQKSLTKLTLIRSMQS